MADNQYEYRIKEAIIPGVPCNRTVRAIWIRSTNYAESSPYGWATITADGVLADEAMLVKMAELATGGEVIPVRAGVGEYMSKEG